jgi:hypothetical protein
VVGRWLAWVASDQQLVAQGTLRGLAAFARLSLAAGALLLGPALLGVAAVVAAQRTDLLVPLWRPFELAVSLGRISWLGALAAGATLGASGVALLARRGAALGSAAPLALGVGVSLFLALVFHPFESAGRSVTAFYRQVAVLVGDDPIAVYGSGNWAPNRLLERSVVSRVSSQQEAERFRVSAGGGEAWLVAEARAIERLGQPEGFHAELGARPLFGQPLVLLRGGQPLGEAGPPAEPLGGPHPSPDRTESTSAPEPRGA